MLLFCRRPRRPWARSAAGAITKRALATGRGLSLGRARGTVGRMDHSAQIKAFIQNWLIAMLAVLVAVWLIPGITYDRWYHAALAALLLGILNSVLRPLLLALTFWLVALTLGLFLLVINALLLWLVGALLAPHFTVDGFWPAFWGALVISLVTFLLNLLTGTGRARLIIHRRASAQRPRDPDDGPVIDV